MNIPKTIIVMGRSGSGKGTQINLLKEAYTKENPNSEIFYFYPGSIFRNIVASQSYTSKKINENTSQGILVPDFITNGLFINEIVQKLQHENQLLIFDGYPRNLNQLDVLDSTLKYYGRDTAVILHIDVSEQEVRTRMQARNREDDKNSEVLENRMKFYNENVLPTLDHYRNLDGYRVIDINGVGDIHTIQQEILTQLSTLN